ncbi:MAG: hypothetical protein II024_04235 [Firmicutes bacterium]|nr:hypothetical protein [Bacillota bacterium]
MGNEANAGRHAFLIMAHTQKELLARLLKRLDNERVDIYLHLDRKSPLSAEDLPELMHSNLFLTRRIRVSWGSFSTIKAEMILLQHACKNGRYSYYHYISGQDYPLCGTEEILRSYDETPEVNYISYKDDETASHLDRLALWYPFQEKVGRDGGLLYYVQRALNKAQSLLKLFRKIPEEVGFGSAFFDITGDFACWIVNNWPVWEKKYRSTFCADEMYFQTLFRIYQKEKNIPGSALCDMDCEDHGTINKAEIAIKRAIDWKRGNPYVWTCEDFDLLISSGCLFARKMDEIKSSELLDLLDEAATV